MRIFWASSGLLFLGFFFLASSFLRRLLLTLLLHFLLWCASDAWCYGRENQSHCGGYYFQCQTISVDDGKDYWHRTGWINAVLDLGRINRRNLGLWCGSYAKAIVGAVVVGLPVHLLAALFAAPWAMAWCAGLVR